MEFMKVAIEGKECSVPAGVTLEALAKEYGTMDGCPIVLAVVNGRLKELFKKANEKDDISFVTTRSTSGYMSFRRSACMVMLKAFRDVIGKEIPYKLEIRHSIGDSLYCEIEGMDPVSEKTLKAVDARMREIIKEDLPFVKKTIPLRDADRVFSEYGDGKKRPLFRYRMDSNVNVYFLDGYVDYFYGFMLPSTGYLTKFSLELYGDGFVLTLPPKGPMKEIVPFVPRRKLYKILEQSKDWARTMNVASVADLNQKIAEGKFQELILVQEALMEKRIGDIAEQIAESGKKVVLVAGPSSSGKTTFSHRLSIQLMALGLEPYPIAMDDYFVDREKNPIDPKTGKYDFEALGAVDVELFNKDMNILLDGGEIDMPTFNFITGKREYKGKKLKLGEKGVLVIEGIHGLNEECSKDISREDKFKIYISALTTINVDEHNRISTSDGRLLRRMVRDVVNRGASPAATISMWNSVRAGEEKNIFPFQEEADVMFNSSLIYEISILKQFAQPLLFQVEQDTPEGLEARRLLKFLSYFLGTDSAGVPGNSILREFIGGSCF